MKSIGEVVGGGTPSTSIKEYWDNGNIVWVTPSYMSSLDSNYLSDSNKKITKLGLDKSSAKLMPKGSIIMSSRAPIGYIAISTVEVSTSQGCKSLVPFLLETNEFLFWMIKASILRIIEASKGTTFNEISGKNFAEILIPLAPLKEQFRICKIITDSYTVINNISNNYIEIENYVSIAKRKILDLFFGDNSSYKSYYPNYQIKDLCKLDKNDVLEQGLHPYLEAKVIRGKKTPEYIQKGIFIKKGTKIILVDGENSGEVMIAPCDGYLGSTFRILNANEKINDEYLMWFIECYKKSLKSNRTGSAVPHLNKKIFYELKIPLPPINIQEVVVNKIANFFNQLNIIIS